MRLVLDEMWTPTIALELRKRGFDVIAISEPAHAGRYAGISDEEVFTRAQDDGRAIVTDNIADYEQARRDHENTDGPITGCSTRSIRPSTVTEASASLARW